MTSDPRPDPAQAGLEHLQAAAREVIKATRSFLDAAEELVEDPHAVQGILTSLTTIAQAAANRLRSEPSEAPDVDGSTVDPKKVQRIRLS